MDFPNLLTKIKSSPQPVKSFIAIEIAANSVKTAVWKVQDQQTEIVSLGSIQDWMSESDEDLLVAIDTSLSEALAGLEAEPNEVIFGLPETWVGEEAIAENKKPLLKKICTKLGLKPVGFVVSTEAIVHYLQDTEGGPPSAILVQLSNDQVIVSLVEQGKLEGVQAVGRSGEIHSDVEEGLARFSKDENLPNRIVLYDSKEDLEGIKQELISHDWQSKLAFLHFPQIEILPKDSTIKAVALSGGAEVAKSLGMTMVAEKVVKETKKTEEDSGEDSVSEEVKGSESEAQNETEDSPPSELPPVKQNEFGFEEVEIDMSNEALEEESEAVIKEEEVISEESKLPDESNVVEVKPEEVFAMEAEDEVKAVVVEEKGKKKRLAFVSLNIWPFKRKPKVNTWSKKPKLSKIKTPSMLLVGLLLLVLIAVGGAIFYWQVPEADLIIYLTPDPLNKELSLTLDPSETEVDLENQVLPVTKTEVEMSGDKQTPTTGSLTVGERSKGQVEIFNRTTSAKSLPAGTAIKNGSLAFTLDTEVSLASASAQENADFSVTVKPSSATVAVTAADIGDQYNLSDGSQFEVANLASSDMVAKSTGGMSGGSARDIQAVSQDDVDRLEEELLAQLNQEIKQKVSEQTAGQKGVIPAGDPEVIDKTLSAEVGDEALTLSLSATVKQEIYTYDIKDVSLLGQQKVLSEIPDGYEMMAAATDISVQDSKINEDETVLITAQVSIKLIPIIDTKEVVENVKGKYPPDTQEYLRTLPNYKSADATIRPSMPARLNTFPRKSDNIYVTVEGQE